MTARPYSLQQSKKNATLKYILSIYKLLILHLLRFTFLENEETGEAIRKIAGMFAAKTDPDANYPKRIKSFPKEKFVIDAETTYAAKEILKKHFTFTKQPLDFNGGELLTKNRYNGDILCLWKGQ